MNGSRQINVRIPVEDVAWLHEQMRRNRRSLTGEVVIAIQERRDRLGRESAQAPTHEKAPEALARPEA